MFIELLPDLSHLAGENLQEWHGKTGTGALLQREDHKAFCMHEV